MSAMDDVQGVPALSPAGRASFMAVEQIEGVFVGLGALVGQHDQAGVEMAHDIVDAGMTGRRPALLLCDALPGAAHWAAGAARLPLRSAGRGSAASAAVPHCGGLSHQPRQPVMTILVQPALRRVVRDGVGTRHLHERHTVVDDGLEQMEALSLALIHFPEGPFCGVFSTLP